MRESGKDPRKAVGRLGEQLAAQHLEAAGMTILAANWRCRTGELDLVADDRGTLVFVEVRTRRQTGRFGTPEESIDLRKMRQIRNTAAVYIQQQQAHERPLRFDVVTVHMAQDGTLLDIRHLPNAF